MARPSPSRPEQGRAPTPAVDRRMVRQPPHPPARRHRRRGSGSTPGSRWTSHRDPESRLRILGALLGITSHEAIDPEPAGVNDLSFRSVGSATDDTCTATPSTGPKPRMRYQGWHSKTRQTRQWLDPCGVSCAVISFDFDVKVGIVPAPQRSHRHFARSLGGRFEACSRRTARLRWLSSPRRSRSSQRNEGSTMLETSADRVRLLRRRRRLQSVGWTAHQVARPLAKPTGGSQA